MEDKVKREDTAMLEQLSADLYKWMIAWVSDYIAKNGLPGSREPKGLLNEEVGMRFGPKNH